MNDVFSVRMSEDERRLLRTMAKATRRTEGGLLRWLMIEEARRLGLEPPGLLPAAGLAQAKPTAEAPAVVASDNDRVSCVV
jgi:hypothetical protein